MTTLESTPVDDRLTSTRNDLPQRMADFETLTAALDYAAQGTTGSNFYDSRGKFRVAVQYSELRERAIQRARRLLGLGLNRGDHVAIIADTDPEFIITFFACQYAGLVPFAMPVPVNLGSRDVYVRQLSVLLESGNAAAALAPVEFLEFLTNAAQDVPCLRWLGTFERADAAPEITGELQPSRADEPAYLQFTSGSTRGPRGVVITGHAVMANLRGIVCDGLKVRAGDRCASWLPYYHDMGLVGFVLGPIASQLSVDYLRTRDFAIRPLLWLKLISTNHCTIAFSPPFGFELCARRLRSADVETLDLSCWRAAGVGAEMIRPSILENFAQKLAACGFSRTAFLPCYGLAEASLAVTFAPLDHGIDVLRVDARALSESGTALPVENDGRRFNEFVNCGTALTDHRVAIVDNANRPLPDLRLGRVRVQGPSLMAGYLDDATASAEVLSVDGWLDTGDIGFLVNGTLYLTGRRSDVIIVNGRNIRAQDLEELAEQQPEVRFGDASAFAVVDSAGVQTVVLVVECRISEFVARQELILRLQRLVYEGFGIRCLVELVASHTLPRTSSGKLSRTAARQGFAQRSGWGLDKAADFI
jgi:fatty-acyl-CoA synthase